MVDMPSVAIIIVNWNGLDYTDTCLRSLQMLRYPNYKIILVDNGSSDGSAEFFAKHYPQVDMVELAKNQGFTGGNNIGIHKALKEDFNYVLLLNNDTLIEQEAFLSIMIEACEGDPEIGMACPTIFYNDPPGEVWYAGGWLSLWKGWGHYHKVPETGDVKSTGYTTGCCLLIKKETIHDIGLLNNAYFLSVEDVEWSMRAQKKGWKTVYIPRASIIHKDSLTSRSKTKGTYSTTRIFYECRNSIWFVREYANTFQKGMVWPIRFLRRYFYKALAYLVLGRWGKLVALIRAILDGFFTKSSRFKKH